jgi:glutamate-ammonia-ligase adenylyltransferase
LLPAVEADFARLHGEVPGGALAIAAMGRLGSREMNLASDIDLTLIYDAPADSAGSSGPRPLALTTYYARLSQRLISAITVPTTEGRLYEVDMRLRPSGESGPIASSLEAFADYQREAAWTWEHLALTRARVISSSPAFRARIEKTIHDVLTRPRNAQSIATDVVDMRRAVALEKGEGDIWDLKYAAGGIVDIDFIAQYLQLIHAAEKPDILDVSTLQVLDNAARLGVLPPAAAEVLRPAARLYHDLTQILRLCVSGKFTPETAGEDLLRVMARAGDAPDFSALEARMRETQADVRRVFLALVGNGGSSLNVIASQRVGAKRRPMTGSAKQSIVQPRK